MGADADTSVCDPAGAVRGAEGLYVADASLLPTSVGVNPMMTIIACATHVAGDVAESLQGGRSARVRRKATVRRSDPSGGDRPRSLHGCMPK